MVSKKEPAFGAGRAKTFAESLTREREAAGLSQADLARELDVSRGSICYWESGQKFPELSHQMKLVSLLPGLAQGPMPADTKGSPERIDTVRAVARLFLDDSVSPEDRQARLEELRRELPRRDRRMLRIPSPDKPMRERPALEAEMVGKECPRCHLRVLDLGTHKGECPKKAKTRRWELAGPPATPPLEWTEAEIAAEVAPWPAKWAMEEPATEVAVEMPVKKGLEWDELVERCLTIADLLWPDERHALQLQPTEAGGSWYASVLGPDGLFRAGVDENGVLGAVDSLARALRGRAEERLKNMGDLVKLLEDGR